MQRYEEKLIWQNNIGSSDKCVGEESVRIAPLCDFVLGLKIRYLRAVFACMFRGVNGICISDFTTHSVIASCKKCSLFTVKCICFWRSIGNFYINN